MTRRPPVRLRLLPRSEGEALTNGLGAPPVGVAWDPDYPTEDTLVALGLLRLAHDAAGFESAEQPRWWLYQIVVGETGQDLIVGDIGFHGPPGPGARAVVEIGYYVVPGWRGLGVATRACALLLEQAWRDGADVVRAEAQPADSRAVLLACGFAELPDPHWFEVTRP